MTRRNRDGIGDFLGLRPGGWIASWALAAGLLVAGVGCSEDAASRPGASDTASAPDGDDGGEVDGGPETRRLDLEGLSAPVTVDIDRWGIPHIRCRTNADCITAQGYIHAKHRFFEMDLIRHQTLGQLSSIVGAISGILESDKRFRHLMTTREGERLEKAYFEAASPDTRQMFRAYADGINAWLDDVRAGEAGAELTTEYDSPLIESDEIRDWKPTDTVALYLRLAEQLGQSATGDLARARRLNALGAEVGADIFGPHPALDSSIMGEAKGPDPGALGGREGARGFSPDGVREAVRRLAPASDAIARAVDRSNAGIELFGPAGRGGASNSWAVAPRQTESGATLMANDPHLSLDNPAIWYFVELDSETQGEGDLHVAGASIPSVPGVIAGHNEDVAWSVTTARMDLADAYIEELNDEGDAVLFEGEEVPLTTETFEFDVRGEDEPKEVQFQWVPHHGPLLSKDVDAGRAVSLKWVAHDAHNSLDFFAAIMRAESVEEAEQALSPIRAINQNWVLADRDGSIAWHPEGAIPKRPWASAETPNWLPLPGDGSAEWQGFVAPDAHPSLRNPGSGMIATANNDFDGSYHDGDPMDDGHTPWQRPPTDGHRHARIVERLEADAGELTAETMVDIQADTHSLHGERLVPEIVDAVRDRKGELSATATSVVEALSNWTYTCPTGMEGTEPGEATPVEDGDVAREAVGCAVFHVMLPYLTESVFADELRPLSGFDPRANWYSLQTPLLRLFTDADELIRGDAYFDDQMTEAEETKADVVQSVVETTADKLETLFDSSDADDWRWGKIHTVTFRSLFAQAGLDEFNIGPFINDGGFWTVDVANPHGRSGGFDDDFGHRNGPSMRMVYELDSEGVDARFQLPGGQDHHRDSRWYGSLIDDWLSNTPNELWFGPAEMSGRTELRFELAPEN